MQTTPKILIVEDDAMLAMAIESIVQDMGYWVIGPMHTLRDGLDHATTDDVDFALLDFDLGNGTDATPIAEKLTARGIPFAFTTATDPKIIHRIFAGVIIIPKPIDEAQLERVLPN